MPGIGNQIVYMIHNIAIGPYDCQFAWNAFHFRRIKCAVESIRQGDRSFCRMVWQQQGEFHFWVKMFRFLNGRSCKAVKSTVVTDDKFGDAIFNNVLLHSRI